jgi:hypothetical protein
MREAAPIRRRCLAALRKAPGRQRAHGVRLGTARVFARGSGVPVARASPAASVPRRGRCWRDVGEAITSPESVANFSRPVPSIGPDRQQDRPVMRPSRSLAQHSVQAPHGERGAAMSVSSGEKRRRKRDRQFLEFYDTLSARATVAGVAGSIALLLFVVARSVFS